MKLNKFFTHRRKPIVLNLRTKLLMIALTMLIIPWIGYQYVNAMESYLRRSQADALLAMARAVSVVLNDRVDLFRRQTDVVQTAKNTSHLYVQPLTTPIRIDGYADDWRRHEQLFKFYGKDNILESHAKYLPNSFWFEHAVGSRENHLYVIFKVHDDKIVYRLPNSLRLDRNDHLQIAIQSPKGDFSRFIIATVAPGWVSAYYVPDENSNNVPDKPEIRIKGEWQETKSGYIIEIRIPLSMIGNKIAFAIADVDDPKERKIKTVIGTAGTRRLEDMGTVMVPSPEMEKLLKGLERKTQGESPDYSATRTWVIDNNNRVIARTGTLVDVHDQNESEGKTKSTGILHTLTQFLLKQPSSEFKDELSAASKLGGSEVDSALKGMPATHRRRTSDNQVDILSVGYPVWQGNKVMGAVVMEQTSNSILVLQNRALENLISFSFIAFVVATGVILWFATRLSGRVRRLLSDAENAIGPDGRVRGSVTGSNAGDEIGDLSRAVAAMLERLGQYNRYLETMASKLSHELRTPLTVVKSSLDNLELQTLSADGITYTKRAREGVERLSDILTRMSEASRLEQSLLDLEREVFPLDKVVRGCVEGYKIAYPNNKFELWVESGDFEFTGAPDLIAQMLDKLVSNAIDFSPLDKPIRVGLYRHLQDCFITVANEGALLPKEMQGNLFDSLVSVRAKQGEEPHLGLGLYIVRLIVDFHRGMVNANDTHEPDGVEFMVILPQQSTNGKL